MSQLRFRLSFAYHLAALCLCLAYLLQVTVLPVAHFHGHVTTQTYGLQHDFESETEHDCHNSNDRSASIVAFESHTDNHDHDGHTPNTCSICSGIHECTPQNVEVSTPAQQFPVNYNIFI